MSNFTFKAKNNKTGTIINVEALDNYFGEHKYGYTVSSNNAIYNEEQFNALFEEVKSPAPHQDKETWIEEFDKLWGGWDGAPEDSTKGLDWYIKSFISSLLHSTREETIREIHALADFQNLISTQDIENYAKSKGITLSTPPKE